MFTSLNGSPISPDSVNNTLRQVLEHAGISKVRFRDLRHTFVTLAQKNGVDIITVSCMMGHFSVRFTLDTYIHVTTSTQKKLRKQ